MPLLNYTTEVDARRSIGQVTALLVEAGARSIMTNYNDVGTPTGIVFALETPVGQRAFTLPVNADRVLAVLTKQKVPPRFRSKEQAERVAWRILKDWVEAQLAIIKTEMVTLDQVMLPYMQVGLDGETVYDLYLERQLALPAGES